MRKLKKALSLVLAIALVLGLCTIGAAAIKTPNGVYEGGLTIEYHVTANDLSRLLAVEGYGANAEVDDLRLIFKDDLTPGIDSLDLIWNEASDSYGSVAYSNYMGVQPDCIKSLAIKLSDGRNLEVSESDLTANYIGTGSRIYELSLTEADETYLVTFWAQQGNALHWTRYSVVAVEKGGTVGNKMPADPDTGNYVFIGWELGSHDGSGSKFTADTVVNSDINVYARKVSVGGGSAYHVMNPDTELNAYAAAELGAASAEAVTIDSVRVNGQDEEATNPSYITNGWEEHNGVSYFYIYNDDAYAASFDPQYNNTRVPASEVTSITLFCTLNGEEKEVNIGIDELELAVVSDVVIEIRLHQSVAGGYTITASAGENGSISPVGNVSVAAGADQSFSFFPSDGFTVDTLTVNNTTYKNDGSGSFDLTGYTFSNVQANGSIRVTFAADANDNDIPDYKEKKYGVTYEFVSGTDGKVLPGSDMPAPPSDNSEYLIGITVINKGESTYEAVSVDDGTWTFTGWDANEKVMSKDGITFTGYWTFTPNEPEPGTYTIEVEVINGTAEFMGTNIGAHNKIVAAADEDITITFTPDEGYTLDYATIDGKMLPIPPDGVYTLKQVDSNHTIKVVYAEDKLGDGEDGNKPDGTPDYRQVFVKYVAADENGFVTPSFDTFNLEVDEIGKVMTNVALSLSGEATPNADATFAYWTIDGPGYDGGAYSYEADLSGEDFTGYFAGKTYTFTAYFNGPVVKPEQPNVYNIYVTVHNGTATFYGSEVTSHIPAVENEDITITFTPDEGYTLDYATIDGKMLPIPPDGVYTLKQVDSNHTIKVVYAEDKLGDGEDGNKPDGTPDYRQVFVKYVAADENGFVTPSFDTFNLEVDEIGKVMTNVALSLSGEATPNADATFAYWTIDGPGYDGGAYSYEADLSGEDFTGYFAGQTYTFTAYFNVKPEQVAYDINVEVVNGTAEFKGTNIGANSVINVYPIEDDNKNVTITFVPEDGFVFDAAYVGNEPVDLEDNSYTFDEVTADVTIKVLFKQDSVPITPVTPMPTPGEISDLIKDSITVDCVNGEVAHADKVYGLLDGSLVNVEKTDDTSIKVTLDATVYQARYNTDTETKHSLASGQSATVTFTLKYVDSKWTLPADAGELPATIKVVCATPAAPKAPTEDELKALFDGKVFVDCVEKSWHPTYAYGLLADGYTVAGPVKGADGEYTCTVTLLASAYLAEYNDDVTDKHTLASYQGNETVALKWTGSAWTVINGELPVTFDVVCDTWYPPYIPPVAPSEPVYRPNWLNTTDHFGYIIGYEDGTIKPDASITRAEVATIFFRLLTDEARDKFWTETNSYSDVAETAWYNNAVSTLSRMGILGGYEDGSFRPNDSITRAEFAKIAVSFFEYEDISAENIFTDVAAGSWYENFVAVAAKLGLIEGYAGNVYRPNESITRAEACTIINRTLGRAPDADHLLPESEMNTWPDNRPGVWYYAQLQEATNSHEYKWSGDIEHWTAKLPERDWDALQR